MRLGKAVEVGPVPLTMRSISDPNFGDQGSTGVHVTFNAGVSIEAPSRR